MLTFRLNQEHNRRHDSIKELDSMISCIYAVSSTVTLLPIYPAQHILGEQSDRVIGGELAIQYCGVI